MGNESKRVMLKEAIHKAIAGVIIDNPEVEITKEDVVIVTGKVSSSFKDDYVKRITGIMACEKN